MKASAAKAYLQRAAQRRKPVLLQSRTGVGKTSISKQTAAEMKQPDGPAKGKPWRFLVWHPAISDPTDFKGMPYVGDLNGKLLAEFVAFGNLHAIMEGECDEYTIVLIDDVGQALQSVQAALAQILLAREIDGKKISDKVTFIAATNRREDNAGVVGFITMFLQRFESIVELTVDKDDWVDWALAEGLPTEIIHFVLGPGGVFFTEAWWKKFVEQGGLRRLEKYPDPRAISQDLTALFLDGERDQEIYEGAVGRECATSFLTWLAIKEQIPDVTEVFLSPDTCEIPDKPDLLHLLCSMLAERVTATNMEQALTYLNRIPNKAFVGFFGADVQRRGNAKALRCKAWIDFTLKNPKLFGADAA